MIDLEDVRLRMDKVVDVLRTDLATVRTGRATPSLVEHIVIAAYGGSQRLKVMELATIQAIDHQTLVITPFDSSIITELEKGMQEANVGLNPVVDGSIIRISIPALSEERRRELIHLMKQKLENGRIMVRQVRHEEMSEIKKQYNDKVLSEDQMVHQEREVQRVTDEMMGEIDVMGKKKEEELVQI